MHGEAQETRDSVQIRIRSQNGPELQRGDVGVLEDSPALVVLAETRDVADPAVQRIAVAVFGLRDPLGEQPGDPAVAASPSSPGSTGEYGMAASAFLRRGRGWTSVGSQLVAK